MIQLGAHRLYKLDSRNWVVETVVEKEGEQVGTNRKHTAKLDHALMVLLSSEIDSPKEKVETVEDLINQVREARDVIISEVKGLEARLQKVEAGITDISTIKDEIVSPEKEGK